MSSMIFKTNLLLAALCLLIASTTFAQRVNSIQFEERVRQINFNSTGSPLHYHSYFGFRWQHLQDMLRLEDANGKEYYMGTFSQNVAGSSEGGIVFVAEVDRNGTDGKVIWWDVLHNTHPAGGYNHPGDLRRVGNTVIIAGQNWDKSYAFADPMDMGNGGNHVLFYDVSDPSNPTYTGKMNSCGSVVATGEIDYIAIAKVNNEHLLTFNGVPDGGVTCKSNQMSASATWAVVPDATMSSRNLDYHFQGNNYSGGVYLNGSNNQVLFDTIGTNYQKSALTSTPITSTTFGNGTTFNMTVNSNGRGSAVYTNVESGTGNMQIKVIETKAPNFITTDQVLQAGDRIVSANGEYSLDMQVDGHLCIYRITSSGGSYTSTFHWGTMVYGYPQAQTSKLVLQGDGNLVVYSGDGQPKWCSATHPWFNPAFSNPAQKPVKLVLENNGMLNLYNSANQVVWSAN